MTEKTFNFAVSPDFPPEKIYGWYLLNTYLQKNSGLHIHLLTGNSFSDEDAWLADDKVDFIYANPFRAQPLIREFGYLPVAQPTGSSDEIVIAAKQSSLWMSADEVQIGSKIAATAAFDVKLMGLRLLEPASVTENDLVWISCDSYPAVAKAIINGSADCGIFLQKAWSALSSITRKQLRPLVESRMEDLRHVILAHPRCKANTEVFFNALSQTPKDILDALGVTGFAPLESEDAEFLIDILSTLVD